MKTDKDNITCIKSNSSFVSLQTYVTPDLGFICHLNIQWGKVGQWTPIPSSRDCSCLKSDDMLSDITDATGVDRGDEVEIIVADNNSDTDNNDEDVVDEDHDNEDPDAELEKIKGENQDDEIKWSVQEETAVEKGNIAVTKGEQVKCSSYKLKRNQTDNDNFSDKANIMGLPLKRLTVKVRKIDEQSTSLGSKSGLSKKKWRDASARISKFSKPVKPKSATIRQGSVKRKLHSVISETDAVCVKQEIDVKIEADQMTVVDKKGVGYHCQKCNKAFPTTAAHNRHIRGRTCFIQECYRTPGNKVACGKCNVEFQRQDYLDVHDMLHSETNPAGFITEYCELMDLVSDIEASVMPGPMNCGKCDLVFGSRKELLFHVITCHGAIYKCEICEEVVNDKKKLFAHRSKHKHVEDKGQEEKAFKCEDCGVSYCRESFLLKHRGRSHCCSSCTKTFSSATSLAQHEYEVHCVVYICPQQGCGKVFKSKLNLKRHKRNHIETPTVCSLCGKVFNTSRRMKDHLRTHSDERKFVCPVCNKSFKTSDVLTKHKRLHKDTFSYTCEICGFGCHSNSILRRHIDTHNQVKRHGCTVCGTKYSNKESLVIHKLRENHYKPDDPDVAKSVQCDHCDRRFPSATHKSYAQHLRTHTGEKPYQCKICGRQFSEQSNMKTHELIHREEKPFLCVCGKGFVQKRFLRKHLEKSQQCASMLRSDGTAFDFVNAASAMSFIVSAGDEDRRHSAMETGSFLGRESVDSGLPSTFVAGPSGHGAEMRTSHVQHVPSYADARLVGDMISTNLQSFSE